jgi:hypothetical protein
MQGRKPFSLSSNVEEHRRTQSNTFAAKLLTLMQFKDRE